MDYPIEILPQINRKLFSCSTHSFLLIRSTPSSKIEELIDESTQEVLQKTICTPREHISDLSTSLFGVFDTYHNKIELIGERKKTFSSYCKPDANIEAPIFNLDFSINENKGFWTVQISNIENKEIKYVIDNHTEKVNTAKCKVIHSPTCWNYWHFSIRWYLSDHNCYLNELEDSSLKKKITKRISTDARAILARFANIKQPDSIKIPDTCYQKE